MCSSNCIGCYALRDLGDKETSSKGCGWCASRHLPAPGLVLNWPQGALYIDIPTTSGFTLRVHNNGQVFVQEGSVSIGLGVYDTAMAITNARRDR